MLIDISQNLQINLDKIRIVILNVQIHDNVYCSII